MTTSFATYASQFLTRQRSGGASSLTSSQPLFFSFSTDDDRSRAGHEVQAELDDLDDPHLRASDGVGMSSTQRYALDDPYLQLDEDERSHGLSAPLLASHAQSDIPDENEPSRGWLAHQPTALRTPSPPSPSPPPSSSSSSRSPPPDFLNTHRQPPPPTRGPPMQRPLSSAPPPPQSIAVQLTESLLPRDNTRPASIFSLPDPRFPAPRRKYHDPLYTTMFLSAVSLVYFFALLLLFITNSKPRRLPYQTLLHTVPLLVILTFVSAAVSYTHIMLLRVFVKPVVVGTSVFIPVTLFISSIWSFVGSFMWDGDEPTWGETWGLRLFSLVPLALAVITGRRLVHLPAQVQHTSSLLTLTTRVLSLQPLLLLLSPSVLLAFLLASIPFLTLAFRLLLIGYTRSTPTGVEYHVKVWANWAIAATAGAWVWSWGVARGLCRATTAGVVAAWYFADPTLPPPPPQSTHTIHAALYRATHPSLGTIAFAALLLTCVRALSSIAFLLRRAPAYLPLPVKVYAGPLIYGMGIAAGYIENWVDRFGRYVLIYVGITGTGFWASVGRSTSLTAIDKHAEAWRRRFQTDPPLTLLTVTPLTLTLPFALSTYLFVAHTLNAPDQALEAAFLAGGVTALVGLFCVGLVKDTADTLYLCYCIDKEAGERRRAEVFEMFEFGVRNGGGGSAQTRAPHPPPPPPAAPQPHAGQPISRRVEEMYSPGSSPGLGGTRVLERSMPVAAAVTTLEAASTAEDIDPFLRAESSDEEEDDGPVSGYSVHMDDEDENASVSEDEGRAGMSTRMIGSSGRDAEEGLGSGLGGLFPGSDMF